MSTSPGRPHSSDGGAPLALAVRDLGKRYGALAALDGAQLSVRPGTVHALLGENGAGKTTLMRAIFGLVRPDAGTMQREGRPFAPRTPLEAIAAGVGMVFQHFSLVPAMTVAENIALGGRGRFDPRDAADVVRTLATRTGLSIDPAVRIADAGLEVQQRCEILKALARDARLLMLDEPTAVLAPDEAQELLRWLRAFADQGNAVVLVTHRLRDALAISDDITVLRRGRTVLATPAAATDEDALARAMIGEGAEGLVAATAGPTPTATDQPIVLAIRGVQHIDAEGRRRLDDVALTVRAGEIVGVAAIEGQGQHELLRVLAGRLVPTRAAERQLPAVIGFVPEDRHRDALLLDGSLTDNVALRDAQARRGRMPWSTLAAQTQALLRAHDVRAPDERVAVRALSGGNQQKFVLGRELADRPAALIVENPTRGLDIRATQAVRRALQQARADGMAIVCYSSDLDELLALADRVVVVSAGRITAVARERDAMARAMVSGDRGHRAESAA